VEPADEVRVDVGTVVRIGGADPDVAVVVGEVGGPRLRRVAALEPVTDAVLTDDAADGGVRPAGRPFHLDEIPRHARSYGRDRL
jgi:hypothetical protein